MGTRTWGVLSSGWRYRAVRAAPSTRLSGAALSQVISFSRIVLVVGLVFLHYGRYPNVDVSPFGGVAAETLSIATFLNSFVLFFFFSVVPVLSCVSGWLFFSFRDNAAENLATRMRRRFASLYLPLIFWNCLYLLGLYSLFLVDAEHPVLGALNIDFAAARYTQYINAVLALTQHPIGFQFWFVRDLFVTVLVSPVLWLVLRKAPLLGAVALGGVWLAGLDLWIFFRTDVLFFFYLGGLLRQRRTRLEIGHATTVALMALYVGLVALRTLAPYVTGEGDSPLLEVATRGMRIVGVLACWGLFQRVAFSRLGERIARFAGFAFFLYAIHFPLIAAVKVWLWHLVPSEAQGWMMAHYFASVVVTVFLGLFAAALLARLAPQQFALLNGGRLADRAPGT